MSNVLDPKIEQLARDVITDYNRVRARLLLRLANGQRPVVTRFVDDYGPGVNAASTPATMPAFCDLCRICSIWLCDGATILVNEHLADRWDVSKEQLFADALANSKTMFKARMEPLSDAIKHLTNIDAFPVPDELPMYIVSNEHYHFGASAILYCDKLPEEFYMLPSSIHEVIILPVVDGIDPDMLPELVRNVNADCVDPKEWLSDNAYIYKKGEWEVIK